MRLQKERTSGPKPVKGRQATGKGRAGAKGRPPEGAFADGGMQTQKTTLAKRARTAPSAPEGGQQRQALRRAAKAAKRYMPHTKQAAFLATGAATRTTAEEAFSPAENAAFQDAAFWRAHPARLLGLFCAAAQGSGTLPAAVFAAAVEAAPALGRLEPPAVRAGVERMLLSPHPEAVGVLVGAQGLAAFGFYALNGCGHTLAEAPCTAAVRWAALIALCGADPAAVARALWMPEAQARAVQAWLKAQNGPRLAVTQAQLHAEGIRGAALPRVWQALCAAAEKCPALNTYDRLDTLAHGLARLLR